MAYPRKSVERLLGIVTVIVLALSIGPFAHAGGEVSENVVKAFELRMSGKVDEAKAMLDEIIQNEADNAAAYFELARTTHHMGLGNPRDMKIEETLKSISKAMELDPDNVIYAYFSSYMSYMKAYIAMSRQQPTAKEDVAAALTAYESVLKLKPDYHAAALNLVELYSMLPEDQGGDEAKAELYAAKLEEMDEIFGAKARLMMMPEDTDVVKYWEKVLDRHEGNAAVLEELGKAYMGTEMIEDCVACFEKAVAADTAYSTLFLDLGRYYVMTTWRDASKGETTMPASEKAINRYLESDPLTPLKAFSMGLLAKVKREMKDEEGAKETAVKANEIDAYYSKAFAIPPLVLFEHPAKVSLSHKYMLRPF